MESPCRPLHRSRSYGRWSRRQFSEFTSVLQRCGADIACQTVLILKYIIPDYTGYIYYGIANVGMNAGVMIS